MSESNEGRDGLLVTVRAEDLSAVLDAVDYVNNRSLRGPVDRMGDALALVYMRADGLVAEPEAVACRWGTHPFAQAVGTTPNGIPICEFCAALSGLHVTRFPGQANDR